MHVTVLNLMNTILTHAFEISLPHRSVRCPTKGETSEHKELESNIPSLNRNARKAFTL
jgi:hypothetical protein